MWRKLEARRDLLGVVGLVLLIAASAIFTVPTTQLSSSESTKPLKPDSTSPTSLQMINYEYRELLASEESVEVSRLMLIVTTLGVIFVAFTLRATRIAARAAQDAVQITQKVSDQQNRAYLLVRNPSIVSSKADGWLEVRFSVVNAGLTPAWQIVASYTLTVSGIKAPAHGETGIVIGDLGSKEERALQGVLALSADLVREITYFGSDEFKQVELEIALRYGTATSEKPVSEKTHFGGLLGVGFSMPGASIRLMPSSRGFQFHAQSGS
jgi:hypothetical protein